MKTTQKQKELLDAVNAGRLTSKAQFLYLFKSLNNLDNKGFRDALKDVFKANNFEGIKLSAEQNEQGYNWLLNLWKTPIGKNRQNNPFGYREQNAIDNFEEIVLKGYYDIGRSNPYYIPLFDVYSKNGYGFEYYMSDGKVNIVG